MKIQHNRIIKPKYYYKKLNLPSKRFFQVLESVRLNKKYAWEKIFIFDYYFSGKQYIFTQKEIIKLLNIPSISFIFVNGKDIEYTSDFPNINKND